MIVVLRLVLALGGLAMIGWGGWFLYDQLLAEPSITTATAGWLLAGPVLTDLLLMPVAAALGWALSRLLPGSLRAPVTAGLVVSTVLVAIAVPFLWRAYAANHNPGLVDGDYLAGLGTALIVTWVAVLLAALLNAVRKRWQSQ